MTRHIRALAFACAIVGASASAWAQGSGAQPEDDPAQAARFHFGVLRFTPAIAINNIGVDNNVFNTATNPTADTTAAVGPVVRLWLKTGPAQLSGTVGGQYLYYKTYANQRAWNTNNTLRYESMRGRVRPFATGAFANTKDRPGFEIDSRVRQQQRVWTAGATIRTGGHSSLLLEGGQTHVNFDDGQANYGVNVAAALNRRTDLERAQFRNVVTPLTTWVLSAETIQDRFDQNRERNSDSVRVTTGFELRPAALIAGTALVGFRRLNVLDRTAPDYNGLAASVAVTMLVAGSNRISLIEQRDVNFSYDSRYPFFVLTSTSAMFTHRFGTSWDAVGRGALHHLNYRTGLASADTAANPTDRIAQVGVGTGYFVGGALRVGLDADYYTRTAQSGASQAFKGFRAGLSISYGMPK